ncbi:glycogen debranching protein GlgX [Kaistia geumhonensis]|uniref:Glycogen operon protein n=1 Tax=Kaistia geumhonensis TaxID=410839 RepID=A0ABU0M4U9_9HYPH|nr:glycogen debranching protein GlgX [Kaistia geumhonensis]MCX5478824.1 glycogen debranching protein GlgX [Kaistia geumhonensis]MDQ0515957.1 glycogen operon protein [Kaistia geumhonensis]
MQKRIVSEGSPFPLGVTPEKSGVNVAVHSAADHVELCLFSDDGAQELERIALPSRSGDVHFGHIAGIGQGARYGLRAHGPFRPEEGLRFNPAKLLVDPYARSIDRPFREDPLIYDARRLGAATDESDSAAVVPKGIVRRPLAPAHRLTPAPVLAEQVIYELHVRGFSKLNADVPEALRGTFAGLGHPASIRYLTGLGVTMVELLPVAAWLDERHLPPLGLSNYWGYNPVAWFVPDPRLAPGGMEEVRAAVAALHEAGIAVILDVVYNHSGESDHLGPTLSMRGLDNAGYYRLLPGDKRLYVNDAGCGNVLALERPQGVRLAMDAMRHWVTEAGVDGFRFDLATTLARRDSGFDPAAPILSAIVQDPLLSSLVLIAEPWDIGYGGYQVGAFPPGWGEWNDRYRDTLRRFMKGEGGLAGELATRIAGSADTFAWRHRQLAESVNFVTAHDGFTLADLVSYEHKRNHANGEDNRDGNDSNHSWNNGVEGETSDPAILRRRAADMRALLAALVFSHGTPMLAMGDEIARSQGGNNNAYAQDNPIAWMNWEKADTELLAFTSAVIALRAARSTLRDPRPLTGAPRDGVALPDVAWFGADGRPLEGAAWNDGATRVLTAVFTGLAKNGRMERTALILSGGEGDRMVSLPRSAGGGWRLLVDSIAGLTPANDPSDPLLVDGPLLVKGRATLLLADTVG